ncbi:hypothetical protein CHISP_0024 [Chitinispirillum alkaliphilum]|nr:hypothetical protein CHISP_0024 [Chitinispirillum alkaliphilum]
MRGFSAKVNVIFSVVLCVFFSLLYYLFYVVYGLNSFVVLTFLYYLSVLIYYFMKLSDFHQQAEKILLYRFTGLYLLYITAFYLLTILSSVLLWFFTESFFHGAAVAFILTIVTGSILFTKRDFLTKRALHF